MLSSFEANNFTKKMLFLFASFDGQNSTNSSADDGDATSWLWSGHCSPLVSRRKVMKMAEREIIVGGN